MQPSSSCHVHGNTPPLTNVPHTNSYSEACSQTVQQTLPASSEKTDSSVLESPCNNRLGEQNAGPGLVVLPRDVLLIIAYYLPTVSLIACAAVHPVFSCLLTDVHFLNRQTRHMLGFAANEKDVTYDVIPPPVSPVQKLWFQTYLHQAAPYFAGLVTPGVVFYDLLCFKHLLDTWILQGLSYKYCMFVSDVLKNKHRPPVHFLHCKPLIPLSNPMLNMLTKLALCHPEVFLQTVNNFETLTLCEPSSLTLNGATDVDVAAEEMLGSGSLCEVVSHQRGRALAAFTFTSDSQTFCGWSGVIEYPTFRRIDTWGQCKIAGNASLSVIQQQSHSMFEKFSEYVGQEYISTHCTRAFMFHGLCRLIQLGKPLLPQLHVLLENNSLKIHRKICKLLPSEQCAKVKNFLDSVMFVGGDEGQVPSKSSHKKQLWLSRTLQVAVQRYLHRYLNLTVGWQVLELYQDPVCHHVLCVSCHNSKAVNSLPSTVCMRQVGPQRVPLKIWPPHLLQQGLNTMPTLTKLVCLDMELWKRGLLDQALPPKVDWFVRQLLSSVHLNFDLDSCRRGVIAQRIFMQQ